MRFLIMVATFPMLMASCLNVCVEAPNRRVLGTFDFQHKHTSEFIFSLPKGKLSGFTAFASQSEKELIKPQEIPLVVKMEIYNQRQDEPLFFEKVTSKDMQPTNWDGKRTSFLLNIKPDNLVRLHSTLPKDGSHRLILTVEQAWPNAPIDSIAMHWLQ